jgi:hypothetical protein
MIRAPDVSRLGDVRSNKSVLSRVDDFLGPVPSGVEINTTKIQQD